MLRDAVGFRERLPEDIQLVVDGMRWRLQYAESLKQLYCAAALMSLRRRLGECIVPIRRVIESIVSCPSEEVRRHRCPDAYLAMWGLTASVMRILTLYPTALKRRCPYVSEWVLMSGKAAWHAANITMESRYIAPSAASQCRTWREQLEHGVERLISEDYVGVTTHFIVETNLLVNGFVKIESQLNARTRRQTILRCGLMTQPCT